MKDFHRIQETNLFGIIYGSRAAVEQFRRQGSGILINMGSLAGIIGQPFSTPYSISKAGIRALGISLGQELENEKHIHVCTVHPSIIDTPVYQNAANFTGHSINPPTSATPALKVAKAIIKLTKHPQREVFVGKRNLLLRMNRLMAPKLFNQAYRKVMEEIEMEDELVPKTSGNLFEPIPEHASISGG
jgi:short-subunit dehydrogenase